MEPFRFDPHQSRHLSTIVSHIERGERLLGMYYCTGGGKSVLSLGLLYRLIWQPPPGLTEAFTHGIIFTPTNIIKRGFSFPVAYQTIRDGWGDYPIPLTTPDDLSLLAREVSVRMCVHDGGAKAVKTYLESPYNKDKVIWRSSHSTGRGLLPFLGGKPNLRGKIAVFDEGHHGREDNKTQEVRDKWLACGGTVVLVTATPNFNDAKAFPPDIPYVLRPLRDQMAEGFAPDRIDSELMYLRGRSVKAVAGQAMEQIPDTELAPRDISAARPLADHIAAESNGGPPIKAIVRAQPIGKTGENAAYLISIAKEIQSNGIRVFIAVPAHENIREVRDFNRPVCQAAGVEDLEGIFEYERRVTEYGQSCVDVILGLQAIGEGFDWPICSHIYLFGVPQNLVTLVQSLGRVARLRRKRENREPKYRDYPTRWIDTSKVILVTSGIEEDVKTAHLDLIIRACAYLTTFRQWSISSVLVKAFEGFKLEGEALETTIQDIRTELYVQPHKEQAVQVYLKEAMEWLRERVEIVNPLTISAQAKLLLAYLRNPKKFSTFDVNGQVTDKDREVNSAIVRLDGQEFPLSREEVRNVIRANNKDAEKVVLEKFRGMARKGTFTPEAVREALQKIDDEVFGRDPTQEQMSAMISQMLSLTAQKMSRVNEMVEVLHATEESQGGYDFIREAMRT